jgi:hypothetical protein
LVIVDVCFERLTSLPSGDSRNCQTLGVSPAKPGVYQIKLSKGSWRASGIGMRGVPPAVHQK